ncbi:MAG TPA: protein translocase subunit SecD, partial [Candidatus Paceibacterota bacterium]|nr:protein translocase subunit SecD [Candidatus Paceibacterota bacterium]
KGAQLGFSQYTNEPLVYIEFTKEGSKLFEDVTARNVGKPVAIFLDNNLLTQPTVQQKIIGGKAQITGNFNREEAQKLVERFNAGALPAPIELINQQTVSPTLGKNSLNKSIIAGILGFLAVILYMIAYYRKLGLFASISLFMYVSLVLGIFKIIPVTMTLSGVAGFILSIGIAVDANILVFERMKEELDRGLVFSHAVEEGFKRAWSSIRDSNITTIISCVILFYFTSGFVQGFALTLLIGVLVSMFSAITITRTILRIAAKE